MSVDSDATSPQTIVDRYSYVYKIMYGREPTTRYVGNQWFQVNGEMVHYRTMIEQIDQLHALARRKRMQNNSKGMVRRLIDKLRLL
ncbi:MAG: hypothetical protein EA396_02445 [Anaerolineaceae bacterium]|nr:MAG: hypothetical protein EA396_02445 [Anaerolineaceae bacterium]